MSWPSPSLERGCFICCSTGPTCTGSAVWSGWLGCCAACCSCLRRRFDCAINKQARIKRACLFQLEGLLAVNSIFDFIASIFDSVSCIIGSVFDFLASGWLGAHHFISFLLDGFAGFFNCITHGFNGFSRGLLGCLYFVFRGFLASCQAEHGGEKQGIGEWLLHG